MSLFKAPYFVINKLEKWQRNFLWNGCSEERGFHAVNWNIVKVDVVHRGLGVVDMRSMNFALLCKWLWRYTSCPTSWWRKVIDWKNGGSPSYWRFLLNSGFGSLLVWKNILHFDPLFWTFAFVDTRNGNHISFWYDCWVQGEAVTDLKSKYPRVFAEASDKEACIADIFYFAFRSWNLHLNVNLRGGAFRELESFFRFLESQVGSWNGGLTLLISSQSSHFILILQVRGFRVWKISLLRVCGAVLFRQRFAASFADALRGTLLLSTYFKGWGILLQTGVAFVVNKKRRCIICSFPEASRGRFGRISSLSWVAIGLLFPHFRILLLPSFLFGSTCSLSVGLCCMMFVGWFGLKGTIKFS
ncbi:Putative ribonuclease H protein At1g65750 [Linum perenne]